MTYRPKVSLTSVNAGTLGCADYQWLLQVQFSKEGCGSRELTYFENDRSKALALFELLEDAIDTALEVARTELQDEKKKAEERFRTGMASSRVPPKEFSPQVESYLDPSPGESFLGDAPALSKDEQAASEEEAMHEEQSALSRARERVMGTPVWQEVPVPRAAPSEVDIAAVRDTHPVLSKMFADAELGPDPSNPEDFNPATVDLTTAEGVRTAFQAEALRASGRQSQVDAALFVGGPLAGELGREATPDEVAQLRDRAQALAEATGGDLAEVAEGLAGLETPPAEG